MLKTVFCNFIKKVTIMFKKKSTEVDVLALDRLSFDLISLAKLADQIQENIEFQLNNCSININDLSLLSFNRIKDIKGVGKYHLTPKQLLKLKEIIDELKERYQSEQCLCEKNKE